MYDYPLGEILTVSVHMRVIQRLRLHCSMSNGNSNRNLKDSQCDFNSLKVSVDDFSR